VSVRRGWGIIAVNGQSVRPSIAHRLLPSILPIVRSHVTSVTIACLIWPQPIYMYFGPAYYLGEACTWLGMRPENRLVIIRAKQYLKVWDLTQEVEYTICGDSEETVDGYTKRSKSVPKWLSSILRASDEQLKEKLRWPWRLLTVLRGDVETFESEFNCRAIQIER
jgi:hypothetical protein